MRHTRRTHCRRRRRLLHAQPARQRFLVPLLAGLQATTTAGFEASGGVLRSGIDQHCQDGPRQPRTQRSSEAKIVSGSSPGS